MENTKHGNVKSGHYCISVPFTCTLNHRNELAVQYTLSTIINWNVSGGNIGFLEHKEHSITNTIRTHPNCGSLNDTEWALPSWTKCLE